MSGRQSARSAALLRDKADVIVAAVNSGNDRLDGKRGHSRRFIPVLLDKCMASRMNDAAGNRGTALRRINAARRGQGYLDDPGLPRQ
jgi:hypothetical protein